MLKINDKPKDIAFAILVGGKSTRFKSDKGLFKLLGKPLVSHLIDTLIKGNYDIFLVAHSPIQVQNYINNIDVRKIVAFILDDPMIVPDSQLHAPLLGLYSAFKELNELGYKRTFSLSMACVVRFIPFIDQSIESEILNPLDTNSAIITKAGTGYLSAIKGSSVSNL